MHRPYCFLTVLLLLALVIAAPRGARGDHEDAARWFPLEEGNEWVLRDPASGETRIIRCDFARGRMRHIVGLFSDGEWFFPRHAALLLLQGSGRRQPFLRFAARSPLEQWRFNLSPAFCDTYAAHWEGEGLTVETPAGTFTGCRKVVFQLLPEPNVRCFLQDLAAIWLAPEVGPVRLETGNGRVFDLEAGQIDGRANMASGATG